MDNLTKCQKLLILFVVALVAGAALLFPLLSLATGRDDADEGSGEVNGSLSEVIILSGILQELKSLEHQIVINLNNSGVLTPKENHPEIVEQAKNITRRKRDVTPVVPTIPVPLTVTENSAGKIAAPADPNRVSNASQVNAPDISTPNGTVVGLNSSSVLSNSTSISTNVPQVISSTSPNITNSTSIKPTSSDKEGENQETNKFVQLVDNISNVLDMLDNSIKKGVSNGSSELGNSTITRDDIKLKIHDLTKEIGIVEFKTPADKQLALDLLAKVMTSELNLNQTIETHRRTMEKLVALNVTITNVIEKLKLITDNYITLPSVLPAAAINSTSALTQTSSSPNISTTIPQPPSVNSTSLSTSPSLTSNISSSIPQVNTVNIPTTTNSTSLPPSTSPNISSSTPQTNTTSPQTTNLTVETNNSVGFGNSSNLSEWSRLHAHLVHCLKTTENLLNITGDIDVSNIDHLILDLVNHSNELGSIAIKSPEEKEQVTALIEQYELASKNLSKKISSS